MGRSTPISQPPSATLPSSSSRCSSSVNAGMPRTMPAIFREPQYGHTTSVSSVSSVRAASAAPICLRLTNSRRATARTAASRDAHATSATRNRTLRGIARRNHYPQRPASPHIAAPRDANTAVTITLSVQRHRTLRHRATPTPPNRPAIPHRPPTRDANAASASSIPTHCGIARRQHRTRTLRHRATPTPPNRPAIPHRPPTRDANAASASSIPTHCGIARRQHRTTHTSIHNIPKSPIPPSDIG